MTIKAAQLNCKYRAVAEPVSGRVAHVCVLGLCRRCQDQSVVIFPASRSREAATNNNQTEEAASYTISIKLFFYRHTTAFGHNKGALCDLSGHPYLSLAHDGTRAQHDASRFSPKTRDPCKSKVCAFPSRREDGARFFVRFPFIARVLRCSVYRPVCLCVCARKKEQCDKTTGRGQPGACVRSFMRCVCCCLLQHSSTLRVKISAFLLLLLLPGQCGAIPFVYSVVY